MSTGSKIIIILLPVDIIVYLLCSGPINVNWAICKILLQSVTASHKEIYLLIKDWITG